MLHGYARRARPRRVLKQRPYCSVGTRSGFGGRRLQADLSQLRDASFEKTTSAKMTTSMPPFLKKLGIEKPEDAVQMLKDKAADLDVSSATAFAEQNLDIVKAKQSAALVDVAAAAACGLLFAGVYGAVVLAARRPSCWGSGLGHHSITSRGARRRCLPWFYWVGLVEFTQPLVAGRSYGSRGPPPIKNE